MKWSRERNLVCKSIKKIHDVKLPVRPIEAGANGGMTSRMSCDVTTVHVEERSMGRDRTTSIDRCLRRKHARENVTRFFHPGRSPGEYRFFPIARPCPVTRGLVEVCDRYVYRGPVADRASIRKPTQVASRVLRAPTAGTRLTRDNWILVSALRYPPPSRQA